MPLVGIIVETPALVQVGMPIYTLAEYEVNREINAVSSWSLAFTCAEPLAAVIKSRYRISIIEEGRTGYLLRRGIITGRTFRVSGDASGVLALQGFSRLWKLNGEYTHQGLVFDGVTNTIETIADTLMGEEVITPASATSRKPKVTYNDITNLSALFSSCEYVRYNARETFGESLELVEMDNVPDSGYQFMLAREAGTDRNSAASRGIGLISGNPTIGHDGVTMATRIIPIGTDFDGSPLTLEHATTADPFPVQMGTNPDGTHYWYLEIASPDEVIELMFNRSDVKNPNDNPTDRATAANVLYALAASKLLLTQRETLSFSSEIANGNKIDALPGSRVRVKFVGQARTPWHSVTWEEIDRHMLITKRRDVGFAGTRRVGFTLTCPESSLAIPSLPDAVPIPPPVSSPDPPEMTPDDTSGGDEGTTDGTTPEDIIPEKPMDLPPSAQLDELLKDMARGRGKLQPCCADPGAGIGGGGTPPPFDIVGGKLPVPGCTVPFVASALQDFRFVNKWGLGWADTGLGDGLGAINPVRDRAVVFMISSSAQPICVCSGATVQELTIADSSSPANFGGDGHTYWSFYYIIPTASFIDFTGSTGVSRQVLFMRAEADLTPYLPMTQDVATTSGGGENRVIHHQTPSGTTEAGIDMIDLAWTFDLQYHGSMFGHANEVATADQSSKLNDLVGMFINDVVRTIDDITIDKSFFYDDPTKFDSSWHFHNAEPVPFNPSGGSQSSIDWMQNAPGGDGTFSIAQEVDAVASDFPGSCRVLSVCAGFRVRALCHVETEAP